jgi:hypothetical protein
MDIQNETYKIIVNYDLLAKCSFDTAFSIYKSSNIQNTSINNIICCISASLYSIIVSCGYFSMKEITTVISSSSYATVAMFAAYNYYKASDSIQKNNNIKLILFMFNSARNAKNISELLWNFDSDLSDSDLSDSDLSDSDLSDLDSDSNSDLSDSDLKLDYNQDNQYNLYNIIQIAREISNKNNKQEILNYYNKKIDQFNKMLKITKKIYIQATQYAKTAEEKINSINLDNLNNLDNLKEIKSILLSASNKYLLAANYSIKIYNICIKKYIYSYAILLRKIKDANTIMSKISVANNVSHLNIILNELKNNGFTFTFYP